MHILLHVLITNTKWIFSQDPLCHDFMRKAWRWEVKGDSYQGILQQNFTWFSSCYPTVAVPKYHDIHALKVIVHVPCKSGFYVHLMALQK